MLKLIRFYRVHSPTHGDHYVSMQVLGGAGYTQFNGLRISRDSAAEDYYDWRSAFGLGLRRLAYVLGLGRTLTVYLPGHYRAYSRTNDGSLDYATRQEGW